ncbi:hypothetical protein DXG03_009579 [Asterophora parasitica]|uniref:Uncharacterized protein n=1 Tax=Asterophora parasitica TaxID=117018 RepID=A0A9P7G4C4_9AGAR|nr:hypothetical protein DXG03_009579 [Asterophora parasitica]
MSMMKVQAIIWACCMEGIPTLEPLLPAPTHSFEMDSDADEFPSFSPYMEEEDDIDAPGAHSAPQSHLPKESDRGPPEDILDGEHIYATVIHLEQSAEHIRASQTMLQHLTEAFAANLALQLFRDAVPDHLHDFEDVFAKALFDLLLDQKQ